MEGCLQSDQGPGKETADEQGMIRGVHKAGGGAIIGLKHNGSSRDTRSRGCRGQYDRVTGLGNASLRGLLGDAALVRAVGERCGGGEVGLWTGVLLAAHVQRAQSHATVE